MIVRLSLLAAVLLAAPIGLAEEASTTQPSSVHDFTVQDITGQPVDLAKYKGNVLLIVNVASKCGFTPQYAPLQKVYEQYKDKGLVVLAFPANNFKGQEPGTNEQIKEFCSTKFGVNFPLFAKISVKGDDIAPLYAYLTSKQSNPQFGGDIKWNFTKFLVSKTGQVVNRFESKVRPDDKVAIEAIEAELAK